MISVCGSLTQQTHRNDGMEVEGGRRQKLVLHPSCPIHSFIHTFTWGGHDHKELTPLSPPLTQTNNEVCGKGYST